MNDPYKATDLELERLEKRLKMLYSGAYRDLQDKVDEYFDRLKDRAEDYKEKLEAGEITRDDYSLWMINQLARGERFYDLRDEFAQAMTKTNEIAAAYINDTTPGIYSLNHNYTAYEIERVGGNIGFTLYDTSSVRRLLVDNPELFPKLKVDIRFPQTADLWRSGCRLGIHGVYHSVYGRTSAALYGYYGAVSGENLSGGQTPSALYHCRDQRQIGKAGQMNIRRK